MLSQLPGSVSLCQLVSFARAPAVTEALEELEPELEEEEEEPEVKISKYQIGLQTLKDAAGGAAAEFTKSVLSSATISAATGGALALPAAGLVLLNTARGAAVGASKGFTQGTIAATRELERQRQEKRSTMKHTDSEDTGSDGQPEDWDAHKAAQFIITSPALYGSYGGICMYEGFTNVSDCFISDWPDGSAGTDVGPRWDYQCVLEFPNGESAAAFLEDPRTRLLQDSFTSGYMVLAMHSKQWTLQTDPLFCSLYQYIRALACTLGIADTEQDLLTPSPYFINRDDIEGSDHRTAELWWSPQMLDGLATHLASLMKSPQTSSSCTVTSFNHFDGRVKVAGKSSGLEDSAIKLGGRLLYSGDVLGNVVSTFPETPEIHMLSIVEFKSQAQFLQFLMSHEYEKLQKSQTRRIHRLMATMHATRCRL